MSNATPPTDPTQYGSAHPTTATTKLPNRWIRLAFTIVPFLIYLLAEGIPLPTVIHPFEGTDFFDPVTVVRVGIIPWVLAAVMVEIGARVVPDWQRLRHEGATGRAELQRMTNLFGLLLVFVHTSWITITLIFMGSIFDLDHPDIIPFYLRPRPYSSSPILSFVMLLAASMFARLLAEVVSRRGLANGYGVIFAGSLVVATIRAIVRVNHDPEWMNVLQLAGNVFIASMLLTWFVMMKLRSTPIHSDPLNARE
jgi:preprotein translocase subunit SecY